MTINWKKVGKVGIVLLVVIAISVGAYFLLSALGVTDVDTLRSVIERTGAWSKVVFLLLQIVVTILLSFVPGTSMLFITLGVACFGANWQTFVLLFSGVFLSSVLMDVIGRFGGSRIIIKLIGKDSYEEALDLIQTKGAVYVPVMYLLPVFPDDAICMVSGALKVKWWVHYLEILLCRGIGCATIVFGVNLLPEELMKELTAFNWTYVFEHLFSYLEVVTVLAFWVILIFKGARFIDKKVGKMMMAKKTKEASVDEHKRETIKEEDSKSSSQDEEKRKEK